MTLLALLLAWGATARLTLLLTADAFPPIVAFRTAVLRYSLARIAKRFPPALTDEAADHWAYTLVTCPWCCSFWIGLPAAAVAYYAPSSPWFLIPAAALTASLLSGLTAGLR